MHGAVEVELPGRCHKTSLLLRLEQWYRDRPCIDGQLKGDLRLKTSGLRLPYTVSEESHHSWSRAIDFVFTSVTSHDSAHKALIYEFSSGENVCGRIAVICKHLRNRLL
ncbi:hypothetical protein TNIN_292461 [Trichonephila inaurata madagascariensis]|uniref:Uncharacterized protein n=1 Tax=Trichonephila inaurata madagascariensis TaxID=2747483 RepID=A0A8X7CRK3_9ARAC|nr:hypothetical protein TNIN_292461 [Trichonephila inaurata madagascariensis]